VELIKAAKFVRVNKIAIFLSAAVAVTIGILPATLTINRFDSITYFLIAALIGAAIDLRHLKSLTTEKPSLPEFMIGWIGAIFWGVLGGLVFLFFYFVFLGGTHLFGLIATWLGFGMHLDAEFIAYIISFPIAFIVSLACGEISASSLAAQLYPSKAHVKSVFYELTTYGKRRLVGYIGFALLALGIILLGALWTTGSFTTWWLNPVLLTYLLFVSIFPYSMGEAIDSNLPKAMEAVGILFKAKGYRVVLFPITGKPEFDPLLGGLDFFVQNNEHALALVVRTEKTQPKDQWEPSDLLRSTRALNFFLQEESDEINDNVIPVIVFIGKEKGEWQKKEVRTIEIPDQELIDKVLKMNNQEELKETASRYLQFSNEGEDLSALKDNLNVSGEEL